MIETHYGARLTVYETNPVGWSVTKRPVEILLVRVSGTVITTHDERRWSAETGELRGHKRSRLHVEPYREGDEDLIERTKLLDKAMPILSAKPADIARLSKSTLERLSRIVAELGK